MAYNVLIKNNPKSSRLKLLTTIFIVLDIQMALRKNFVKFRG